jgi:hypothetical protein
MGGKIRREKREGEAGSPRCLMGGGRRWEGIIGGVWDRRKAASYNAWCFADIWGVRE